MKFYFFLFLLFIIPASHAARLDVSTLKPGEIRELLWDEIPVFVYRRTATQIEQLKSRRAPIENRLLRNSALVGAARTYNNKYASMLWYGVRDIESKHTRSIKDEYLVVLGLSSYFECYLKVELERKVFIDPCSNAEYGLDGRLRESNGREFYHLFVPPHTFEENILVIGEEVFDSIKIVDFSPDIMNLNITDGEKLIEAIQWQKYELALSLLRKQDVIHYQTITGATAMHAAAARGDSQLIGALAKAGFNVNKLTRDGVSPLKLAILGRRDENAVALLKLGAKIDAYCKKDICAESVLDYLHKRYPMESKQELEKKIMKLQDIAH